ncbi:MAG: tetratricopeptide repeat protein [Methylocella sp.]
MGTLTVARGRGQLVSSVRGREAREPRPWRHWAMPGVLVCMAIFSSPAAADRLRDGTRAFAAHDYVRAARIFADLAPLGDPRAQTYLGYMFANGKGVPQNYMAAAGWYRCASQQDLPAAQYMLGLMYDNGQGVPQDYVIAYALLDRAVAGAGRERERWVRIRDAVATKLSLIQRTRAQQLAFEGPPGGSCLPIVVGY